MKVLLCWLLRWWFSLQNHLTSWGVMALLTVFLCYSNAVFSYTLIPGLIGDALTVEQEKNLDDSYADTVAFTSDLSLWYALQEKNTFESQQGWWNAFSLPNLVEPQLGVVGGEKITKGIKLNPQTPNSVYSVYSNNQMYWFDLPETMNWITLTNTVLEGTTGVKGVLYFQKLVDMIPNIEEVKRVYEKNKKILQGTVSALKVTVNVLCTVNNEFLAEKGVTSNLDQLCEPIKQNLAKIWDAIGGTSGILDTVSAPKADFGEPDFLRLKKLFESAKNVKKLSDLKTEFWSSIQNELALTLPTFAVETAIKTCMTGGEDEFSNASKTIKWSARAVAKYIVASLVLTNKQYSNLATSDLVYKEYVQKYDSYEKYAQAGRNALLSNYLRSPNELKACILGQLERINDLPKVLDKLAQLSTVVGKLQQSMSNVTQADVFLFLQFLVEEAIDFGKEEALALAKNLFKSVTPARFYRMASAVNTGAGMAWDAVTKPSRIDITVSKDKNNKFSFTTALPPLDHIRYLAIPKEDFYTGNDYILDVVENPGIGVNYFSNVAGKWEENVNGNKYTYTGAYTLSTDPQNNHFLLMNGAKLSVENKAGIRNDSKVISQVRSFFNNDKRNVTVDWHSYRYLDGSKLPIKFERNQSTAFNSNYFFFNRPPTDFNCPPPNWFASMIDNCLSSYSYEEYGNKYAVWSNPVLEAYMEKNGLDKLNFIDFSRIYLSEHKGLLEHKTPGIYVDSTKIALGDAEYTAAFHAYVMIDYDYSSQGDSHRTRLLKNSQRVVNHSNQLIGLNLQLQRQQYFNYWGRSPSFPNLVNVDEYPFYVVIKMNTQKMGEQWIGPIEIKLGDGAQHYLPLPDQASMTVSDIFIYDTVLHNYIQATGRSVRDLLTETKLQDRKENGRVSRPFMLFQPSEVSNIVLASVGNIDSDGDNVPDVLDIWKYDGRYTFDSDNDGIADEWEKAGGFGPLNFEDGSKHIGEFYASLSNSNINSYTQTYLPNMLADDTPSQCITGKSYSQAASGFIAPLPYKYENNGGYQFGQGLIKYSDGSVYHPGEDWNVPNPPSGGDDKGLDVVAVANGLVVYADESSWGGVVIEHNYQGKIWYSHYGHVQQISVKKGDEVTQKQAIAQIGDVGTTDAHLHFEIRTSDHPAPCNGKYWTYGSNGLSNLANVEKWYASPNDFIPSHPAYPLLNIHTINKNNGDIKISGTNLGASGSVLIDGKTVQGQWAADGITLNVGMTQQSIVQPLKIKVVDSTGKETANICYPFIDVCPKTWIARPITHLWKQNMVTGYGDKQWEGYFRPFESASRAEFTAALIKTLEPGKTFVTPATDPFADVSKNHPYAPFIQRAKELGLIQGCDTTKNLFCPDKAITRAEAPKVLVFAYPDLKQLAIDYQQGKVPSKVYSDVTDKQQWYYPYIYALQAAHIAQGYKDGTFQPGSALKRAEMAQMLCIAKFGVMACTDMGDTATKALVLTVSPYKAQLNQSTIFTVHGLNLAETMSLSVQDCSNITRLSHASDKQTYQCTPTLIGSKTAKMTDSTGELLYSSTVQVEGVVAPVTLPGDTATPPTTVTPPTNCTPAVTDVSPLTATLGQATTFTVKGSCLSDITDFFVDECPGQGAKQDTIQTAGGSATQRQFVCTPSYKIGAHSGTVKDKSLGNKLLGFSVNYQWGTPKVDSVTPTTVQSKQPTVFTITGASLLDTTAAWIKTCTGLQMFAGNANIRTFQCTPTDTGSMSIIIKAEPDVKAPDGTVTTSGKELYNSTVTVQ